MDEQDLSVLVRFRNLSLEAANALWALKRGKTPSRDPNVINQDIYNQYAKVDAILIRHGVEGKRLNAALVG